MIAQAVTSRFKWPRNSCRRRISDPSQDAAREQGHCAAPDVEDDAHCRRKGRCGCAAEARSSVPRRLRASGQVEGLERVVQGDCAAPRQLPLGRWRRAGAGRDTAPQHHDCVAQHRRESPGGGRGAGAGRGTAHLHHAHVARPSRKCSYVE